MVLKVRLTKHALDRFQERIVPWLPAPQRERLNNRGNLRRVLHAICQSTNLIVCDTNEGVFKALFYRSGKPPLRLKLVIDEGDGTLITLWHEGVYRRNKTKISN